MKKRKSSQIKAEQIYGDKRKERPRLPSVYLDDEQSALLDRVAAHFGTKKEAIIEGLKLLELKQKNEQE